MTKSPRKKVSSKSKKVSKNIAKKGPYNNINESNANRRFNILSDSDLDSDISSSSDSDSSYDDHLYFNKNKQIINKSNNTSNPNAIVSSGSDDDYSSSSDDENVDFVQLTKQRRFKAMKAVKGLKKQISENSISPSPSQSPSTSNNNLIEQEEPELDDDLVDAIIESEERKMKNLNKQDNSTNNTDNNIVDYSDADDLNGDLENIDFNFSFDDDDNDNNNKDKGKDNTFTDSKNVLDKLRDEDIGEEVIDDKSNISKTTFNKDSNRLEIEVPKFNEKEINSDADYEFDNDDLIQTLMKDNDDLELKNLDNSDDDFENDDFDYLIANQHKIDQNALKQSNSKDLSLDSINNNQDNEQEEDAYLLKEETQAMLDDFDSSSKLQSSFKNRRSSMYYQQLPYSNQHDEDLDDLDLDLLNNFEQFLPKQQAMRRRSSILNQTLLSSSSSSSSSPSPTPSNLEIEENMNIKNDKKLLKNKMKKLRRLTNNNTTRNSHTNSNTSNIHTKDIRKMLGISGGDSNFTSKFNSNAIVDSDDDTKLLEYIFEDSESDNLNGSNDNILDNGNETDEDTNLPKKSGKILGSKHAKEILSSSKDQFRAPKLGTFITKKPFSVIDGFTTRFLHPIEDNNSVMQKAAAINNNNITSNGSLNNGNNNNNNSNIALDELLNISEFDEDYSNVELKEDFNDFFGDKRIPLTAFRNKGLINSNNLTNGNDLNIASRKFSFTDRNHRRKHHHKSSKSKSKSLKNSSLITTATTPSSSLSSMKNVSGLNKSFKIKRSASLQSPQGINGVLAPKNSNNLSSNIVNNSSFNLVNDPSSVNEVLLIGLDSLPLSEDFFDPNNADFEITAPTQLTSARKRKSMSRASKARARRASIVEAQAEGLRQTKSGLFDENLMEDVEALLIDMGDAEEYGFLFDNEV